MPSLQESARWLGLVFVVGCTAGGGSGDDPPADGGQALDGGADMAAAAPGCAPEGYERGACCEHPAGGGAVCTAAGCTLPDQEPEFDLLCLALCDEQCALGEGQVGPCCLLDGGGTGICAGAECLGPAGPQASRVCAAIAALPEGVGCGRRQMGVPLDGPCVRDRECDLDLRCVDDGFTDTAYCAPGCGAADAVCPQFFECYQGLCIRAGRLGQICAMPSECQSTLCIRVEDDGQYCSQPCSDDVPCPGDYACDGAAGVCLRGM
ncbi:MAG: hypothetical protein H6702_10290 [Myxococcales bacterium]|nr:hypothetical protein [Myxococcales bacterium]